LNIIIGNGLIEGRVIRLVIEWQTRWDSRFCRQADSRASSAC